MFFILSPKIFFIN